MKKFPRFFFIFIFVGLIAAAPVNLFAQEFDSIPVSNQQQFLFHSEALKENRTIWVHLPPQYNSATDNYPVLYLLDGGSHYNYVSEMVGFLSGFETFYMPEMIIVAIPNTDRGRDLTPVFTAAGKSDMAKNGAEKFLSFIKNELIPHIEKNYRTQPYRILEGHSLGGLFATYANDRFPELFQATILISPALTGANANLQVVKDFVSSLKNGRQLQKKLFVTLGNENMEGVNAILGPLKTQAPPALQWQFKQYKDENHFSVPYKSMFDGLRFIYANWHMDVFLNAKKLSISDIEDHYKKLSAEFGYTILPAEDFLNQSGYQQLRFKHIEEAIGIFQKNIVLHPHSFNVYDSMGEAYMIKGETALAIANYEKSVELNPANENGKEMLKKLRTGK